MRNLIDFIDEKLKINKDIIAKDTSNNVQYIVIYNYDYPSRKIDYELYDTLVDCALGIRKLGKNWNNCLKFNNFSEDLLDKFKSVFFSNKDLQEFKKENNIENCVFTVSAILQELAKKSKK